MFKGSSTTTVTGKVIGVVLELRIQADPTVTLVIVGQGTVVLLVSTHVVVVAAASAVPPAVALASRLRSWSRWEDAETACADAVGKTAKPASMLAATDMDRASRVAPRRCNVRMGVVPFLI
jgi:hypothetical protein